jgi:hypothetical protein
MGIKAIAKERNKSVHNAIIVVIAIESCLETELLFLDSRLLPYSEKTFHIKAILNLGQKAGIIF